MSAVSWSREERGSVPWAYACMYVYSGNQRTSRPMANCSPSIRFSRLIDKSDPYPFRLHGQPLVGFPTQNLTALILRYTLLTHPHPQPSHLLPQQPTNLHCRRHPPIFPIRFPSLKEVTSDIWAVAPFQGSRLLGAYLRNLAGSYSNRGIEYP